MTPLATKLVFIVSSTVGAATLGGAAYLVENPRTFTPSPPRPLSVAPLLPRPEPPAPVVIPEVVQIPEITVTGKTKPLVLPAKAARPAKAKTFVPCSEWEEMGPANVKKGDTTGVHRVRKLC